MKILSLLMLGLYVTACGSTSTNSGTKELIVKDAKNTKLSVDIENIDGTLDVTVEKSVLFLEYKQLKPVLAQSYSKEELETLKKTKHIGDFMDGKTVLIAENNEITTESFKENLKFDAEATIFNGRPFIINTDKDIYKTVISSTIFLFISPADLDNKGNVEEDDEDDDELFGSDDEQEESAESNASSEKPDTAMKLSVRPTEGKGEDFISLIGFGRLPPSLEIDNALAFISKDKIKEYVEENDLEKLQRNPFTGKYNTYTKKIELEDVAFEAVVKVSSEKN